ncbi:hypothetical protein [uncultured Friedmanniella sp.]|uniref:hypothetical protein n=1 Tax=uncultured Friedmanniella sp. TaxID=335381 RepID=UPI0035CB808B
MKSRLRRILCSLVVLPLAGLVTATSTVPAAASAKPRAVALGDSFASGEGLAP